MLKRILYFVYYLREINLGKLQKFLKYAHQQTGRARLRILGDAFTSTFKYNISILDYFYFRFFERSSEQRKQWAGTGFMYEYQMLMNPPASREVLVNKILFLKTLRAFAKRDFNTYEELLQQEQLVEKWLTSRGEKIVLKNSRGQVGAEVKVIRASAYTQESLLSYMVTNAFNLVEEFVVQHDRLMFLSPSALNTVRVITQIENAQVIILAARLRISINSSVDNLAAGNVAAPIDLTSGKVTGPGVYSDITKQNETIHPVTNQQIIGFAIPYWNEILNMVKMAAISIPENRSIGWDVAVTNQGPLLIEGNHNWCKLLWQLPVNKGLKEELEQFVA